MITMVKNPLETPIKARKLSEFALQPEDGTVEARIATASQKLLSTTLQSFEQTLQLKANNNLKEGLQSFDERILRIKDSKLQSGKYEEFRTDVQKAWADFKSNYSTDQYSKRALEGVRSQIETTVNSQIFNFETTVTREVELEKYNKTLQETMLSIRKDPSVLNLDSKIRMLEAERMPMRSITGSIAKGDALIAKNQSSLVEAALQGQLRNGANIDSLLDAWGGYLSQNQYLSLQGANDKQQREISQFQQKVSRFNTIMKGDESFYPYDRESGKLIDEVFEEGGGSGLTGYEIATKISYIPKKYLMDLGSRLQQNNSVGLQAAEEVVSFLKLNPIVANQIPKDMATTATKITQMFAATGDLAEAIRYGNTVPQFPEGVVKARNAEAVKYLTDMPKSQLVNGVANSSWVRRWVGPNLAPPKIILDELVNEYSILYKDFYVNQGNSSEMSDKLAIEQLQKEWGVTEYGGGSNFLGGDYQVITKHPIENYANTPDNENNKEWFLDLFNASMQGGFTWDQSGKIQILSNKDFKKFQATGLQKGWPKSRVYFEWDGESDGAYHVLTRTDDNLQVAINADGTPMKFYPNYKIYKELLKGSKDGR